MLTAARTWLLPAASVTVAALIAGVAVPAALEPDRVADPAGAVVLTVQEDDDEICPPTERDCTVEREEDPEDPGNPDEDGGGGGDGVCTYGSDGPITASDENGEEAAMVLVAQNGREVPCYIEGRGWYDGTSCYYGPPSFNFDTTPPEGSSEEDGQWYQVHCIWGFTGDTMLFEALFEHRWVEFGDVPTVSPEELAQRAIAAVGLDGVEFRLAPPSTGAGLVGLPVWLGVADDPGSTYWGPITSEPQCDGDLCVEITAEVTSVEWNMGDGTVFTCDRDQHTVWQRGTHDFLAPGNNCHHNYQQASRNQTDGRYQISTTSNWSVEWTTTSGGGESGQLPASRPATTSMQIDEVQVLTGR